MLALRGTRSDYNRDTGLFSSVVEEVEIKRGEVDGDAFPYKWALAQLINRRWGTPMAREGLL